MVSSGFKSIMQGLVEAYEILGVSKEVIDQIKKNFYDFSGGENLFEEYKKDCQKENKNNKQR